MSWGRHDDGFHDHRKVIGLSLEAIGVWTLARSWALRQLSDGSLPFAVPRGFALQRGRSDAEFRVLADELVAAGLWEACADGDFIIHDFLAYNPSKKQVNRLRADARKRMKTLRQRSREHPKRSPGVPTERPSTSTYTSSSPSSDSSSASSVPDSGKRSKKGATDPAWRPADFARWYGAYPKRKNRMEAVAAWDKLQPSAELLVEMLAALEWQRQQPEWVKQGGQFVPYPASYLNDRRWTDEPPDAPDVSDALARSLPGLQRFAAGGAR